MHRSFCMTGTTKLVLFTAWAVASAIPMTALAGEVAWQGTLSIDFVGLAPVSVEGMGIATLDGTGANFSSLRLEGGIAGEHHTPVTPLTGTAARPTVSVGASVELGSGTLGPFWPAQPLTANRLPVGGTERLCWFFPGCGLYLGLPLSVRSGQSALGVGGIATLGGVGAVRISVDFRPWTVRTASLSFETGAGEVVTATERGWVHGPGSFTGSTALTGGALSVVTPVRVSGSSLETGSAFNTIARLQIRFVPEPRRWLLLVPGAAGLALLGRSRFR